MMICPRLSILLSAMAAVLLAAGCGRGPAEGPVGDADQPAAATDQEVVVYTALDRVFSEPILRQFEEDTGIEVQAVYDTEATKTVGLVQRLRSEAQAGRVVADVFWNNEIVNTIRLKDEGLLAPVFPKSAAPYPQTFKDPEGMWYGFAGRARILLVNTEVVGDGPMPGSILDLKDPRWRGQAGIAKPLFGTTATHAAVLFSEWGKAEAADYFNALEANGVRILAGNKQVALDVGAGNLAFGLTDTDDAMGEIASGNPVKIVYPDRKPDQLGTLFIPNTLSVMRDAPHPDAALMLVEYLLSPEVEKALAEGPSAQIPLNPRVEAEMQVKGPAQVKAMEVNFNQAAKHFDTAATWIREKLLD